MKPIFTYLILLMIGLKIRRLYIEYQRRRLEVKQEKAEYLVISSNVEFEFLRND